MRIFDCVLYDGQIDLLLLRFHELNEVVDVFVIVEATKTLHGADKTLHLRTQWASIRPFARKIRYVIVTDEDRPVGYESDEGLQWNAIQRGLLDAADGDLVYVSNVADIPKAELVQHSRGLNARNIAFELAIFHTFLNYRNVDAPVAMTATSCAFPKSALESHSIDQLRSGIISGEITADVIKHAGWHFSEMSTMDTSTNSSTVVLADEMAKIVRSGRDSAGREEMLCATASLDEMPNHVQNNVALYRHLLLELDDGGVGLPTLARDMATIRPNAEVARLPPIIVCPYVFDEDRRHAIDAFGLEQPSGRHLPFFFWKDEKLIGPERAYEHCWKQFPDRDVIIVHTDMRPMPGDVDNAWYSALCNMADKLPDAGLIGCDLLYPMKSAEGYWYAQCAGGFFKDGRVGHFGGGVSLADQVATQDAYKYDERFSCVRKSQWVTFGGVYIRRETIDMVGDFDPRYVWAYVMDVDFCLEAHIRGQEIYQVPINLLHEESKTSMKFLVKPEYGTKIAENMGKFLGKWDWYLKALN